MSAVRRTLGTAGLAGLLVMAPTGAAWAAPTPDPTATASASSSPVTSPVASPVASPTDAPSPSDAPTGKPTDQPTDAPTPGGCDQQPQICQSGGGQPETTTDCDPFATSPPPSGVVCIAGGIRPGAPQGGVHTAGGGAPGQLPRTGPAPLLPSLAIGMWLLLLGTLAGLAGRRRTARI